jgi:outer membrane protein TolC
MNRSSERKVQIAEHGNALGKAPAAYRIPLTDRFSILIYLAGRGMRRAARGWRIAGLLLLLALASAAFAEEPRRLSLDEAVALALENHRSLHAVRMRSEAADARLAEAKAEAGPTAEIAGGYAYRSSVPEFTLPASGSVTLNPSINNSYQLLITARQPVYTGGRLSGARDAAQAQAFAAREDFSGRCADLVLAVRRAYWDLVRLAEERRVVDDDVSMVKAHLDDVERLLAEGMATASDQLKVEARLSAAQFRRIAAGHAVRSASMALADLTGLPLDAPIEPVTPLPAPADPLPPVGAMADQAQEGRPELRALRLRLEAARAAARVARAERLPQVSLAAHYHYGRPNNRIFPAEDRFNGTWDFGVGVSLDLWDGGAAAQRVRQAEANMREAEDALALASAAVDLEVRRAYLSVEDSRAMIAVAATGIVQASEDLRVTRERFLEGLVLNAEVLDAEVALLEARLRHTQALTAHASALAALDRAAGR